MDVCAVCGPSDLDEKSVSIRIKNHYEVNVARIFYKRYHVGISVKLVRFEIHVPVHERARNQHL